MYFSVVVPTFSRPDEVAELLESLDAQENKNFEVIIADGSVDDTVRHIAGRYADRLELKYLNQSRIGISEARNWGVEHARGEVVVFFDSDCVIPPHYFKTVAQFLSHDPLDAYGGPDRAGDTFSIRQKAVSYAMTSFYTTGGIRGRKNHVGQYQPRTFNMGISRAVFIGQGGFSNLRVSEDIDLSMRLHKNGFRIGLIEEAYVFHKRRSTFYKFLRQVFSFGNGRIDLQVRHGDALKPVHILPSLFVLYLAGGLTAGLFSKGVLLLWMGSVLAYMAAIGIDATTQNRNPVTGLLSIYASFVMLSGYGLGMIWGFLRRFVLRSMKESDKPEITKEV